MGWVKLDEGFFFDPRALAAGRDGRDLYLAAMCWSNQRLTDGVVPASSLPLVAFGAGVPDADQAASRLCEVGLWTNHPDGWLIVEFEKWCQTREKREAWLEKDRERKQRARDTQKQQEISNPVRVDSERNPRSVRAIDVDVDFEVDLSSSSTPPPLTGRPADEDERIEKAHHLVARHLAATRANATNAKGRDSYARSVIAKADHKPFLAELARLHPTRDARWLADEHLHLPHPTEPCRHCGQPRHPTGPCPTLLHPADR